MHDSYNQSNKCVQTIPAVQPMTRTLRYPLNDHEYDDDREDDCHNKQSHNNS